MQTTMSTQNSWRKVCIWRSRWLIHMLKLEKHWTGACPQLTSLKLKQKHQHFCPLCQFERVTQSLPIMQLTKQYTLVLNSNYQESKSDFRISCIQQASYLSKPNVIMICTCFKYIPEEKFIFTTHLSSKAIDNLHP